MNKMLTLFQMFKTKFLVLKFVQVYDANIKLSHNLQFLFKNFFTEYWNNVPTSNTYFFPYSNLNALAYLL
jgi:hypothetical protein